MGCLDQVVPRLSAYPTPGYYRDYSAPLTGLTMII